MSNFGQKSRNLGGQDQKMADFHDFSGGTRKFDDFRDFAPKNPLIFSLKSGGPQNFISKKGGHQPIEAKNANFDRKSGKFHKNLFTSWRRPVICCRQQPFF